MWTANRPWKVIAATAVTAPAVTTVRAAMTVPDATIVDRATTEHTAHQLLKKPPPPGGFFHGTPPIRRLLPYGCPSERAGPG
jgi:hypothetical protein